MNHKENQSFGLPLYLISFIFLLAFLIADFMPFNFNVLIGLLAFSTIGISIFFLYRDNFKNQYFQSAQWKKQQKIQYYSNEGSAQNEILEKMDLCPNCNFKLYDNDHYCSNCGVNV